MPWSQTPKLHYHSDDALVQGGARFQAVSLELIHQLTHLAHSLTRTPLTHLQPHRWSPVHSLGPLTALVS